LVAYPEHLSPQALVVLFVLQPCLEIAELVLLTQLFLGEFAFFNEMLEIPLLQHFQTF
jgi:hypothetical protein